jgi:hypothetical protein
VPAAVTPFNLVRRPSASHGSTLTCAAPSGPKKSDCSGVTTTSVASSSSNRETIWLPAVLARPRVATRAATPRMVPSAVSKVRAGRAVSAIVISEIRSASPNTDFGASRPMPPAPA